jgi:hypothetical protein
MRKAILGAASALALASPAVAADLQVTPYSENPGYEQEVPPYAYGAARPYAYGAAPPVIVAPPPVVVYDEYQVYAAPPVYAYAGPVWRGGWGWGHRDFRGGWGWGHRGHFRGGW